MTHDEFTRANTRRGELFDKLIAGTATHEDAIELTALNATCDDYIQEHAPRPEEELKRMEQIVDWKGDS